MAGGAVWLLTRRLTKVQSSLLNSPVVKKTANMYNSLYATSNFPVCFALWLCGLPFMVRDFKNPYDGEAHSFLTFLKSSYVTLPIVTIMLPGLLELLWLPADHRPKWATACQKCFVSGLWNIVPTAAAQYYLHGTNWTVRSPEPHGWIDVGHFFLLLASHEVWFYICHRMNHLEFIYSTTHGHHHKNKGLVFMVNNSDVDIWELLSQGLWGLVFPLFFMQIRSFPHLMALGFFFTYTCTIHSSAMRPDTLHVVHHQYGRHATNYGLYTPMMDKLFGTYQPYYQADTAAKQMSVEKVLKSD